MNRTVRAILTTAALAVWGSDGLHAQEWTRFRGPNGTGVSAAKTIPSGWAKEDINWKIALPGAGHSSPVVWGSKVFVTSGDAGNGKLYLLCIDAANGAVLWRQENEFKPFPKNSNNTFASGSPCVDERRVYVCWALPEQYSVQAFGHDGAKTWRTDLGPFASQHGGGHSPIELEGRIIVGNDQDRESFLAALDSATGKVIWKTPRKTKEAAYSTPCVFQPKSGKSFLVFTSEAHGLTAVEPETGKVLWELPSLFDKRVVGSPLVAGDLIVAACGSGGGGNYVTAVRPGADGQEPKVAFTIRKSAPYVPTSVAYGGFLYLWSDGGIVSRVDPATGQVKWQERAGGNYFSSPVCVDGRLFGVSTRGEVVVLEAGESFKVLARNALGEVTHSSPAIAGGRMYIHTSGHLLSIGGR